MKSYRIPTSRIVKVWTKEKWKQVQTKWTNAKERLAKAKKVRKHKQRSLELIQLGERQLAGKNFEKAAEHFGEAGSLDKIKRVFENFLKKQEIQKIDKTASAKTILSFARIQMKAIKGLERIAEVHSLEQHTAYRELINEFGLMTKRLRKAIDAMPETEYKTILKKELAVTYAELGKGRSESKYFARAKEIAIELNQANKGIEAIEIATLLGVSSQELIGRANRQELKPRAYAPVIPISRRHTRVK
ncbi:MAG: hypothetical protein Q7S92_04880 [Candidatus Diapherotrites archaeon]|nr:hypothetical protein [Candidatus Diapherotrites archaeon]